MSEMKSQETRNYEMNSESLRERKANSVRIMEINFPELRGARTRSKRPEGPQQKIDQYGKIPRSTNQTDKIILHIILCHNS